MSVRVLGATGRMFEAALVVPTVEAWFTFNGRRERRFEIAKSMYENPNGLLFLRRAKNLDDLFISTNEQMEYIGNVATETVKEVLSYLLTEGFYNFSDWEYQQEADLEKIVLDNGKSRPYSSAITRYALSCFIGAPSESRNVDSDWSLCNEMLSPLSNENNDEWEEEKEYYHDTEENGWGAWDLQE